MVIPPPLAFTKQNIAPGSQNGQVFIVRGGNSGIGFGLCKILYRAGASVYMASRSEGRAHKAIKDITNEVGSTGGKLTFLNLDPNDLEFVKAAVAAFAKQESKLDVLWNNAGGGGYRVKAGATTTQGFEPMMGVHCIATLLLSILLVPQLRTAALAERETYGPFDGKTRVLWLSSGMAETDTPRIGINFDDLEGTNRVKNYAVSKALPSNPGNLKTNSWKNPGTTHVGFQRGHASQTHLCGTHIIPWGRIRPDSEIKPSQDLLNAVKPVEEGGLGCAAKLWEWCEAKWKPQV